MFPTTDFFFPCLEKKLRLVPIPRIVSCNRVEAFSILDSLASDKIIRTSVPLIIFTFTMYIHAYTRLHEAALAIN